MKIKSEYGKAFVVSDTSQKDYYERLQFRINKRHSEYVHQPFVWDDSNSDPDESGSTKSVAVDYVCADATAEGIDEYSLPVEDANDGRSGDDTYKKIKRNMDKIAESIRHTPCSPAQHADFRQPDEHANPVSQNQHMRKDAATQTVRIAPKQPIYETKKAFVPYAIGGSISPVSDVRRTFNVKSDRDVYPSAIRAEEMRRARLTAKRWPNSESLKTAKPKPKKLSPAEAVATGDVKPIESNISNGQSGDPVINRHVPSTSIQTEQRLCASPRHPVPEPMSSRGDDRDSSPSPNWLSEYSRKFPAYPPSIYVRSASTAAARCRPVGGSSRPNSAFTPRQRLAQATPVLLSSRGYSPPSLFRRGRAGETHCGVCAHIAPDGRYIPEVLTIL